MDNGIIKHMKRNSHQVRNILQVQVTENRMVSEYISVLV